MNEKIENYIKKFYEKYKSNPCINTEIEVISHIYTVKTSISVKDRIYTTATTALNYSDIEADKINSAINETTIDAFKKLQY